MGAPQRSPALPPVAFYGPARAMLYKIFLVEDEIVTREGIRDNVDWNGCGFSLCGEAPDGEAALPLIQQHHPDVVLTDIRMPFMDGLQLCTILRERLPQTHLVILSGYDDFRFAQSAISLGVSEYLLKPVSARDLQNTLIKLKAMLDKERRAAADREHIQNQLHDSQSLLRQDLLLRLCLGDLDIFEAMERSREAGIDLLASAWTLMVVRVIQDQAPLDLRVLQAAQAVIASACAGEPDVIPLRKDIEELVLIVRGDSSEEVMLRAASLSERIALVGSTLEGSHVLSALSERCSRLSDLPLCFASALTAVERRAAEEQIRRHHAQPNPLEPFKLDRLAVERFLKLGSKDEFDHFFDGYVAELQEQMLAVRLYRDYLLLDLALTASNFVAELGGEVADIVPEAGNIGELTQQVQALEQLRDLARRLLDPVIDFRDTVAHQQHLRLILRARSYIEKHFDDPALSLHAVAAHVNLSPSHFSAIFSRDSGDTYKEYLTRVRINRARELLRTTPLSVNEISQRTGYTDPHYFSTVFKRLTGMAPRDFRERTAAATA